jgi:hypothetical protein
MATAALFKFHRKTDAHMECMDNLAFMRPMQSESMQLIVTTPP